MKSRSYIIILLVLLIGTASAFLLNNRSIVKKYKAIRYEKDKCEELLTNNQNKAKNKLKSDFIKEIIPAYQKLLSQENQDLYLNSQILPTREEKIKFCIVVPSYNNVNFARQNLNSLFFQNYHNWRLIYIDDGSDDGMSELVKNMKIKANLPEDKFFYKRNKERTRKASYTFYYAAHNLCHDDEVMVMLDGDDILATPNVLSKLAKTYESGDIWVTYGHLITTNNGETCPATREPTEDEWKDIRNTQWWGFSHLRTSYTWLFKKIKEQDLMYNGEFAATSWDIAIMYPLIEMAGKEKVKYIDEITYIREVHPRNDSTLYLDEQQKMDRYFRSLKPYKKLP